MSAFPYAKNVVISGGQFNATDNRVTIGKSSAAASLLDILLKHSAPAGLLNAKERFDAPKCDEHTRISTIRTLKEWAKEGSDLSPSSMLWLHGPAGVGKSALAQTLALLLEAEHNHAASFFFSRTAPGRDNGGMLVATLAYQLAMNFPPIRTYMANNIKNNPAIFTASNKFQMDKLIVEPVNQLHRSWWYRYNPYHFVYGWKQPRLIVIDGLDECNDENVQIDLLMTLAYALQRLCLPFRFIVASRPESHILSTFELDPLFQGSIGINITRLNLGEDRDADEDITTFLCKAFQEIQRTHPLRRYLPVIWPTRDEIRQLVSKSSKNFIYPSTVIKYIQSPQRRPEDCLKAILGLSAIPTRDKPYEPLDNLYRHIFCSTPDANKESIRQIFDILVFPRKSDDGLDELTTPAIIEKICSFPLGHVEHVLGDLLCLVSIVDYDRPIKVLHASLSDFLLDSTRSGEFYVDMGRAHGMVARGYCTLLRLFYAGMDASPGPLLDEFEIFIKYLTNFVDHAKRACLTPQLVYELAEFDLIRCYDVFFSNRYIDHRAYTTCAIHLNRFFDLFRRKGFDDGPDLLYRHINALESYILDQCPAARFMDEQTPPKHQQMLTSIYIDNRLQSLYEDPTTQFSRLKTLLDIDFASSRRFSMHSTQSSGLDRSQLVIIYLNSLKHYRVDIWDPNWVAIHVELAQTSLSQSTYCPLLAEFLYSFGGRHVSRSSYTSLTLLDVLSRHHPAESEKLATAIASYLHRFERSLKEPSNQGSFNKSSVREIPVHW